MVAVSVRCRGSADVERLYAFNLVREVENKRDRGMKRQKVCILISTETIPLFIILKQLQTSSAQMPCCLSCIRAIFDLPMRRWLTCLVCRLRSVFCLPIRLSLSIGWQVCQGRRPCKTICNVFLDVLAFPLQHVRILWTSEDMLTRAHAIKHNVLGVHGLEEMTEVEAVTSNSWVG